MPEIREITSGLEFPEGSIAMDGGSVLVVEIKRGTLTRVRPNGSKEVVAETGGGPNGAAIGPDGMVYISRVLPIQAASGSCKSLVCLGTRFLTYFLGSTPESASLAKWLA